MDEEKKIKSRHRLWAEFRFSVIGHLLASPPEKGELVLELRKLALRKWRHPITGKDRYFKFSTIEAWYYWAKNEKLDPVRRLQWKGRKDAGTTRRLTPELQLEIKSQYSTYPFWTYKLHADNLRALVEKKPELGAMSSYPTVRRYMKGRGLFKRKKPRNIERAGVVVALNTVESREVRSFEVEFVNSLWHLDFHKSPIKVLAEDGEYHVPILLGVFDDHSRLSCHMQWYLRETAENLVHAFTQALAKRGIPWELLTDNGSAMISSEFKSGLISLGIEPRNTLSHSPYQNGKCEYVWTKVDGRLMAMLDGQKDLTLRTLNDLTQAWSEMEYNRTEHEETKETPIDRFLKGKDVGRPCPSLEKLRFVFQREERRTQRRSDGTISLKAKRFEVPSRFRHLEVLTIKYASWDLSFVQIVDSRTGDSIGRVYPLDKNKNANAERRIVEEPIVLRPAKNLTELPPLLQKLKEQYEADGCPPAYLPKAECETEKEPNADE